jgi:AmmeMemoRadiSam system protein A
MTDAADDLTGAQRRVLLDAAARAVHDTFLAGSPQLPDPDGFDPRLRELGATFVTLELGEQLLGCIGTLEPTRPLVADVAHNAIAAAFADPRLPQLTVGEYAAMSIKVSVLSRPEPVAVSSYAELTAAVRPGVDGLLFEAGPARSTLLPSVWPKVGDVEEFLDVLWRKAGLRPGTWRADTRVSRYTTDEFGDPGPRAPIEGAAHRFSARR